MSQKREFKQELIDELRQYMSQREFDEAYKHMAAIIELREIGERRMKRIVDDINNHLGAMKIDFLESIAFIPDCNPEIIVEIRRDVSGKLHMISIENEHNLKPGILQIKYRDEDDLQADLDMPDFFH